MSYLNEIPSRTLRQIAQGPPPPAAIDPIEHRQQLRAPRRPRQRRMAGQRLLQFGLGRHRLAEAARGDDLLARGRPCQPMDALHPTTPSLPSPTMQCCLRSPSWFELIAKDGPGTKSQTLEVTRLELAEAIGEGKDAIIEVLKLGVRVQPIIVGKDGLARRGLMG